MDITSEVQSLSTADKVVVRTHSKKRFLVVEDDADIANLVALHLSDLNAEVVVSHDGLSGLNLATSEAWDAVLLDLQLPGMDGLDICRAVRAGAEFIPIMMLTSRSTELDRVLGLEIGADDYMVKPFSVAELKARVKALMRRSRAHLQQAKKDDAASSGLPQKLVVNDLSLNALSRRAALKGEAVELTAKEFDLLWYFASHPGAVFRRSELLDKVWGYGHDGYEHTVNSHINRLRSKIEPDIAKPTFIQTVWGVGYRFAC